MSARVEEPVTFRVVNAPGPRQATIAIYPASDYDMTRERYVGWSSDCEYGPVPGWDYVGTINEHNVVTSATRAKRVSI